MAASIFLLTALLSEPTALAKSRVTVITGRAFPGSAVGGGDFGEFTLSKFSRRRVWSTYVFRFYNRRPDALPVVALAAREGKLPLKLDCVLNIDRKAGATAAKAVINFISQNAQTIKEKCESRMGTNFLSNSRFFAPDNGSNFSSFVEPGSGFSFMSMGPNAIPGFAVEVQPKGAT